jgi:NAD(P)-dependent dehydrogenase (short-subunit alcohol dehydrogenase family)
MNVLRSVVVGGASGIGAAVAARERAAGAHVLVWDVADGADVHCDVADPEQVDAAVEATLDRLGPPATLTVTAGVGHGGMLLDVPASEWDVVLGVNARGVWLAMRGLAGPMRAAGGGSIVAISSVSATLVDRSMGVYCASKAALEMVIKVAAAEWAPTIRVNGVAPGVTDTPMLGRADRSGEWLGGVARRTALGRLGTPEDVAEAVVAVHQTGWLTGEIVRCDGGLALRSPINPLGEPRGD